MRAHPGVDDDHDWAAIRGAVRLYSDFYQSDIIVASPLGLATRLGEAPAEGDDDASGSGPADFLSSIEVAVVARADVMAMQNWAHVKLGATCTPRHIACF